MELLKQMFKTLIITPLMILTVMLILAGAVVCVPAVLGIGVSTIIALIPIALVGGVLCIPIFAGVCIAGMIVEEHKTNKEIKKIQHEIDEAKKQEAYTIGVKTTSDWKGENHGG